MFICICDPYLPLEKERQNSKNLGFEAICFMSYLVLFCSCVFSVFLALRLPRLWGESWSWCFSCVCSICACLVLSVSSSSWCLGGAAVCDCGTPWTFLLPFYTTHLPVLVDHVYLNLMYEIPCNDCALPGHNDSTLTYHVRLLVRGL